MKPLLFPALSVLSALAALVTPSCTHAGPLATGEGKPMPKVSPVRIRLKLPDTTATATLEDNAAAKEFASSLPLTLTLTDYAGTEKVADLPKRLTARATRGTNPVAGDIAYFAPWGNLAIYYKKGVPHQELIKLGRIESGLDLLKRPGPLKVTIELVRDGEPEKGDNQ